VEVARYEGDTTTSAAIPADLRQALQRALAMRDGSK
jgi:hypothetical protein